MSQRIVIETPCEHGETLVHATEIAGNDVVVEMCIGITRTVLVLDEMVEKGRSVDATLSREQMRAVLVAALGLEET